MDNQAPPRLSVLRLGHRRERDKRITSHLGLTARAFGADEVILSGEEDPSALETWDSVTERFGGPFVSRYEPKPMSWLKKESNTESATIVHLTMYGQPWREAVRSISTEKPVIVVVGGTKVPAEVFHISDHNVSVGNQPHSEVSALAVFLDSFLGPVDYSESFRDAKIKVIASENRKVVINKEEE
ncbi:MAG: tRNA (cytidine(56)-2'-O)-methyltransferase [Euryarchaeota archaeon]|nr:tRNA (cytidine(56)-2'-O)-methyltransferase [Euryarchaeota archaeon]